MLTWNVEEVSFVVVHHQLDDDPSVFAVIFQTDDSHDIGGILGKNVTFSILISWLFYNFMSREKLQNCRFSSPWLFTI